MRVGGAWVLAKTSISIGQKNICAPGNMRAAGENLAYQKLLSSWYSGQFTLRYSGSMVADVHHILAKVTAPRPGECGACASQHSCHVCASESFWSHGSSQPVCHGTPMQPACTPCHALRCQPFVEVVAAPCLCCGSCGCLPGRAEKAGLRADWTSSAPACELRSAVSTLACSACRHVQHQHQTTVKRGCAGYGALVSM
jgi:hypothetical protein